ncbi:MAG TPA: hypothetical protein DIT04_09290 [Dysgonomonas sp.]|nr:hypothetical protein [Dysgonomonas sp.]
MKKLFLSLMIFATVSFGAFSQKPNGHRNGEHRIMKELNLSEEQQTKLKSLNEDFKSQAKALKDDQSLSKEVKREKMKELSTSKRNQIQALLTPEQKAKISERKDKRVEKRRDNSRKGDRNFAHHTRKAKIDLNLTDSQKKQMLSLKESFRKQMQDLKADNSLDKEARNAKRKELASSHREQVKSILTPEQQAKMSNHFEKGRKDSKKHGKFNAGKGRGHHNNLDAESLNKLKSLKENFVKEKKAVELSRIAPEAQKEKIKNLREKYRNERSEIVKNARQQKNS